jgi:hypothetical protein
MNPHFFSSHIPKSTRNQVFHLLHALGSCGGLGQDGEDGARDRGGLLVRRHDQLRNTYEIRVILVKIA